MIEQLHDDPVAACRGLHGDPRLRPSAAFEEGEIKVSLSCST